MIRDWPLRNSAAVIFGAVVSLMSRTGGSLKTTGLYYYVRHPIYTGALVWAFGFVLVTAGSWRLLVFALLCLFFTKKARYEEALLQTRFPEYGEYAQRTPRFFPRTVARHDTR